MNCSACVEYQNNRVAKDCPKHRWEEVETHSDLKARRHKETLQLQFKVKGKWINEEEL